MSLAFIEMSTFKTLFELIKVLSGIRTFGPTAYIKQGRLEDVLSLIQVLAFHSDSRRSEEGIVKEFQGKPKSALSWTEIAEEHAEFFRVSINDKCPISLVSRFVAKGSDSSRKPLSQEYTHSLLSTAIEIHDRQVKRSEKWTYLIPVWVALITGFFVLIASFFANGEGANTGRIYKVELIDQSKAGSVASANDQVYKIEIVSFPDHKITITSKEISEYLKSKISNTESVNGRNQQLPIQLEEKTLLPPSNNDSQPETKGKTEQIN